MTNEKKYQVQGSKSKGVIKDNLTIVQAEALLKEMDEIDRDDNTYISDFCEIVEMEQL
jgi:hypothetical protein